MLRREGEYWSVEFGGDAFRVRDAKGMRYLARLLAVPGQEIHALDLVGAEAGPAGRRGGLEPELTVAGLGDAGDLLDDRAKAAYRQRIADLRDEIDVTAAPERSAAGNVAIERLFLCFARPRR